MPGACCSQGCHSYHQACLRLSYFTQAPSPHPSIGDGFKEQTNFYGQILSPVCTLKYHVTVLYPIDTKVCVELVGIVIREQGLKIVSVKMVCSCIFMLLSSKAWITLSGKDLIIAHCV